MRFVAPEWDAEFAENRIHGAAAQQNLMRFAVSLCTEKRTAVDAGAHIGVWTHFLASEFKTVHAFEPVEENMACLRVNVPNSNVVLRPVALGDCRGSVTTEKHGGNSGCWHVVPGTTVEVWRLDDFNLSDVDLIKLDVEGYEGRVLQGARQVLRSESPVIVFENNGLGRKLNGQSWTDPKYLLLKYGYQFRRKVNKDEVWSR